MTGRHELVGLSASLFGVFLTNLPRQRVKANAYDCVDPLRLLERLAENESCSNTQSNCETGPIYHALLPICITSAFQAILQTRSTPPPLKVMAYRSSEL